MAEDSGNHPCFVAKGPCGHYYYAAVVTEHFSSRELTAIRKRKGHVVELKTVQFVREGGLDWGEDCRRGLCSMRPVAKPIEAVAKSEARVEVCE